MSIEVIKQGETVEEALGYAAEELEVAQESIAYEVVSDEDATLVQIKAWVEEPEEDEDEDESEISDEELDKIADTAIEVIRDILKHFGAEDAEIDEYEGDDGELILDVVGADLAILIGRHGKTLDALQQLVSSIVNRRLGFRYPVVVDVEDYKHRRRLKLESIAESAAARAVKRHGDVKLHPMTPYERRLVHIALRDNPDVETFSEGEGSGRRVVVHPIR